MSQPRTGIAASLLACAVLGAPAAGAEPESPGDASLASIAASLERIESLLRLDQSARLIELRLARLDVLRQQMAPLESRLRSYTEVDVWEGPEMGLQQERLEQAKEAIEKARLDGREEQEIAAMETNVREIEFMIAAHKKRQRLKREQAELIENQLASLRSEREAAVAEIDRWLAQLESEMRREREP